MKKLYWFIKLAFYAFVFCSILGAVGLYYLFQHFNHDLPKLDSLKDYNPPVVSEVFADDGTKIGEFWTERRIVLGPTEIPKLVEQAIVSAEDDRFFEHSGIDYWGIIRAMFENLKAGRIVQGGSSITQQVVKSFLLTNERSYERKIKEAILAQRIEESFSKQEILYLYLNQIFFGNRAYGIEAAAENYFHKTAKELNIAEAAMIAGLPKAPDDNSPIKNYPRAKERQEYIIHRMYEEGYISAEQRDRALLTPLKIYHAPTDKEFNLRHAPWFVEEVRRQIIKKYGPQVPYTRGLKIHTSLDRKAQAAAEHAVARGVADLHKRHGYSGPRQIISESDFFKFNADNHSKIMLERFYDEPISHLSSIAIENAPTNIQNEKIYEALVTDLSANTITVQIGKVTGTIVSRDFGWARKRTENTGFYDGPGGFIKDPHSILKIGHVIEVKKITNTSDTKIYEPQKNYFSLEETPLVESALFSHDPFTGYVKAVVGGKKFEKSEFNRATQSLRQTGSIFKALLYGSGVAKGYTADTVIDGSPISIPDGPGRVWTPHNFENENSGPATFRHALTQSINLVSVHMLLDLGTHYVTGFIRNLGVTTPIAKVYSMALGSNAIRLSELAHAIGAYPTGGILQDLIYVKKITDRFGTVVEETQPRKVKNFIDQLKDGDLKKVADIAYDESNVELALRPSLWEPAKTLIDQDKLKLTPQDKVLLYGKQIPEGYVMTPKTAYTMVDVMEDVVSHGTAIRVRALGRPVAGKTGTTNDMTDTWFLGYTPDLVAGVWVGYDNIKYKVGNGEQGGRTAGPVFLYYMQEYLKDTPIKQFVFPAEMDAPELQAPTNVKNSSTLPLTSPPTDHSTDFFLNNF